MQNNAGCLQLGDRIREIREKLRVNQEVFAGDLKISLRSLRYYEKNEQEPGASVLGKILNYAKEKGFFYNGYWLLSGEGPMFRGEEKPPEKRFNFSGKLSDKEKQDLLKMIDSDDGIGRVLYTFLNSRRRDEPVEEERRRS